MANNKKQTNKMALQTGRGPSTDNLIVLTPKQADKDKQKVKPYFAVSRKNETGGWDNSEETPDRVSGTLKRVIPKVKEYKKDGKVIDSKDVVDVYLEDGEDTYLIPFTYKIATRQLFNRLLNLEDFGNLEISYWRDKEGYEVLTLRQNGNIVKGKFYRKNDQTKKGEEVLPDTKKVKVNKIEVTDTSEQDEFFKQKLTELNERINGRVHQSEKDEDSSEEMPF